MAQQPAGKADRWGQVEIAGHITAVQSGWQQMQARRTACGCKWSKPGVMQKRRCSGVFVFEYF